ncbi:MAG: T9SS type A sorting domain-containing protein [Candidatus Eisenbacteria bacterium]|nr:T9SS type A sorting domain-containing protein [Candidatus Eisenbacteria bacterium]
MKTVTITKLGTLFFACALALGIAGDPAGARSLAWTWTEGPQGATILSMLTTPRGTILAGTENGGLYRSTDGGMSWASAEDGLTWPCCNYALQSFAASATSVYAGTWGGGVFRSDDDGMTWYATGAFPNEGYPIILALVACRYGERVFAGGQFGVARSDDGGAAWSYVNDGLPQSWVRRLALRGTVLYALLDAGLYRLDPATAVWSRWEAGLPTTAGMRSIRSSGDALYLSTHEGGVYVLDCDEAAWAPWNSGLGDDNVEVTVEADQDLYAGLMGGGVYRYDWAMQQWGSVNDGLWNSDVRAMTSRGTSSFAGTYGAGAFSYDPDAGSWTWRGDGLVSPRVHCLATDGERVYAGTFGGGIHVSPDEGQNWNLSIEGLWNPFVFTILSHEGAVYAGTWAGVSKSTNQGVSWTQTSFVWNGVNVLWSVPPLLYAGTWGGEVWASDDGGESWAQVGDGMPGFIRGLARIGTSLYAGVQDHGVYALPDGATEWVAMNAGLPELRDWSLVAHGGTLFVGLESHGVYRWNSVAGAWEATGLGDKIVFAMASDGNKLLAGTRGELFLSTNAGQTWSLETDGLKPWLIVRAFAVGDDEYFAGLDEGGVYRAVRETGAVEQPPDAVETPDFAVEPNPSHGGARITFRLDREESVDLAVYDVAGRRVASLASGRLPAGPHEVLWDGSGIGIPRVAAGVYFIKLRAGEDERTAKQLRID